MVPATHIQSYLDVPPGPQRIALVEQVERQTLRQLTQSVQELSLYFKRLFDTTPVPYGVSKSAHTARLAEHLVRSAVDRANIAPIDDFYEGDFDVRRVRWCPTVFGTLAQDLRVDAKASTERSRIRPSASQFSMPATITEPQSGRVVQNRRTVNPHIVLRPRVVGGPKRSERTQAIAAITTVIYVHLHYKPLLKSILLVASPHAYLRRRYNPSSAVNHIWSVGPEPNDPRAVRLNIGLLSANPYSPWRVQELRYSDPREISFADPLWIDGPPRAGHPFAYIPA